ncbi:Protein FAM177A1 [Portunus trituberculatus]|uniref:Protein FAM177A1 n=1 Tax=Portunus trituberculatus TaxID=210409 RepID=A0A5B7D7K4_PORTR|nr:Protein FAM177A1 [Portunus trituberculatus]
MAVTSSDFKMADLCVPSEAKEQENPVQAEDGRCRSQKRPRRILHFSDGIMEEYSTDEEEEEEKKQLNPNQMRIVDPKTMKWGPWLYYWMAYSGSSALSFCDYVGESLANTLGITSPKYQYELDEYNAALEEEKAEKEREKAEMAGWTTTAAAEPSDGIRHKIMDTSVLQEPTLPQPLDQPEIQLALMKNPQVTEVSDFESSNSEPPSSSISFTTRLKYWMSEVHTDKGSELSTWV